MKSPGRELCISLFQRLGLLTVDQASTLMGEVPTSPFPLTANTVEETEAALETIRQRQAATADTATIK